MTTGQNIADEVRVQLNDGDSLNYRWSDAELLSYINAGSRQIVVLVPEANVVEEQTTLVAGSRQTLPTGGVKFFGAWNYDTSGTTRGIPINVIEKDALDSAFPEWSYVGHITSHLNYPTKATEHGETFFEHVVHDPRDPKTYHVMPPVATTPDILLSYGKLPTALSALSETWPLGDEYLNAEVEYVTFRSLMKDGRYGTEPSRRQELWNNFLRALGLKLESESRVDPSTNRPPGDQHG